MGPFKAAQRGVTSQLSTVVIFPYYLPVTSQALLLSFLNECHLMDLADLAGHATATCTQVKQTPSERKTLATPYLFCLYHVLFS